MSEVTVEHMMILPLMVIIVVLFPIAANSVVANYTNQQQEVIAQSAMNQIVSTVQQLYYTINQKNVVPCIVIMTNPLPQKIGSYEYYINATMNPDHELTLNLTVPGSNTQISKIVILSPNESWDNSQFHSTSSNAAIRVEKQTDGSLRFSFQ